MQQHLGRLDGVGKVTVSLADGHVEIVGKEDAQLDPAKVFKATYDSGVSVVEMTFEATGQLERDDHGRLVFRPSANQVFAVAESEPVNSIAAGPLPQKVFMRARLYKKSGKQKLKTLGAVQLEVMEVRKQ